MFVPLQEAVQPGIIEAASWIVGGGGLVATALWLDALYR
jgi:hypothetical protein